MKFSVFESPKTTVSVAGKDYQVNASFDRVLAALAILQDDNLDEYSKAYLCVSMLYKKRFAPKNTSLIFAMFEAYFNQIVGDDDKPEKSYNGQRPFDFAQDAALIYAGFWQAYGIDLHRAHGKLHWKTFVALLSGLPEDTRLMQVIDIRTRPLPKPTKYNLEERQALMRAKAQVRLKVSEEERMRNYAQGLWALAKMLEAKAEQGKRGDKE